MEKSNLAIIEFGDCNKDSYIFIKGGMSEDGKKMRADTYWYPDDITDEEANCEVNDLLEHYGNVAIVLPIPDQLQFEVLPQ